MAEELGKIPETESLENNENCLQRKLKFKLKTTRIEEQNPTEDDQLRVVCEFCNKGFSSGKALGGHMRIHAQENRGNSIMTSKNPKKINPNLIEKSKHLDSLAENPSCDICGKGFPSLKSLFGHMRCHPERDYRGIQPPQTGPNHLSSPSSFSDEKESTFPSWLVKGMRGRASLKPASRSSSLDDRGLSEEEKEVIPYLVMLARGEPVHRPKKLNEGRNRNQMNIGAEFGGKDQNFETRKRKIEVLGYGLESKKPMSDQRVEVEAELGHKDLILGTKKQRVGNLGYGSKYKKLKINKTVIFEGKGKNEAVFGSSKNPSSDDEFGSSSSDDLMNKYNCSTCNKCFSSHQALGGHMSSHKTPNKFKNTNQALINETSPPISRADVTKESNSNIHQCKICNRTFATGQALGGHQRSHWAGASQDLVPSHESRPSEGPSSLAKSSTGVNGFDLNEMPSIEEDDGGVESCNEEKLQFYSYGS